jgi:hypothetical protein
MWHSTNRATRALGRFLTGVCLPFPLAGRPFHRFTPGILNNSACITGTCRMDVSFLLRSQDSRLTPLRALQFYAWAEFPQASIRGSKATHQLASPKYHAQECAIRFLENLSCRTLFYGCQRMAKACLNGLS